uniref:Uncharacterized protein isoform X2 n=1 Tax=Nicotiana tabacum TaxID=4097 RepID=A0A1S3YPK7_TOBAC|nr:PREDICTED: uncharacterized protein LOC107778260 isoform X2 [Nicotiana tabacum]XP_033514243.1 uncharacterized protein LOC117278926 isoform X2 [Nicotiana tomentosiformis]
MNLSDFSYKDGVQDASTTWSNQLNTIKDAGYEKMNCVVGRDDSKGANGIPRDKEEHWRLKKSNTEDLWVLEHVYKDAFYPLFSNFILLSFILASILSFYLLKEKSEIPPFFHFPLLVFSNLFLDGLCLNHVLSSLLFINKKLCCCN